MANDKSFKIKNGLSSPQYLQSTGTSSSQAEPNYIGNPSYDSKSFSASSQTSGIQGITFKTDGTVMYILSTPDDRVYQYTLSTAWDVSTASYASIFYSFSGLGITPTAIHCSSGRFWTPVFATPPPARLQGLDVATPTLTLPARCMRRGLMDGSSTSLDTSINAGISKERDTRKEKQKRIWRNAGNGCVPSGWT